MPLVFGGLFLAQDSFTTLKIVTVMFDPDHLRYDSKSDQQSKQIFWHYVNCENEEVTMFLQNTGNYSLNNT
jgi:hypothetical protein